MMATHVPAPAAAVTRAEMADATATAAATPGTAPTYAPGSWLARLNELEIAAAAGLISEELREKLRADIIAGLSKPEPTAAAPAVAPSRGDEPLQQVLGDLHRSLAEQRDDALFPWKEKLRRARAEREVFARVSTEQLKKRFLEGAREAAYSAEDAMLLSYLLYGSEADRLFLASCIIEMPKAETRLEAHNLRVMEARGDAFGTRYGETVLRMPFPLYLPHEDFDSLSAKVLRQAEEWFATPAVVEASGEAAPEYEEAYYEAVEGGGVNATATQAFGHSRPALFRPVRNAIASFARRPASSIVGAGHKWWQNPEAEVQEFWARSFLEPDATTNGRYIGQIDLTAFIRAHSEVMGKLNWIKSKLSSKGAITIKGGEESEDVDKALQAPVTRAVTASLAPCATAPPKALPPTSTTPKAPAAGTKKKNGNGGF